MTEYHDHNLKVTVNIPVTKEVFEAWERLDGYQDYLLEDFDWFIHEALSKSFSMNRFLPSPENCSLSLLVIGMVI